MESVLREGTNTIKKTTKCYYISSFFNNDYYLWFYNDIYYN